MTARTAARSGARKRKAGLMLPSLVMGGCIVVASLVTSQGVRSSREQTPPPAPIVGEFDTVALPVPTDIVPSGTKGRDIKWTLVSFPTHQVPQGALTSIDSYSDAVTLAALPARLPMFEANFSTTASATNPVLEKIPPGMRAMTIRVDATSAVEGWAGSGSIVDVLLIEKEKTAVVAEKVKILSAERSVSPVDGASAPNVPSTVTLLVTQEQCLAINTAIPLGRIAFALRGAKDDQTWSDTVFTKERLKASGVSGHAGDEAVTGFVSVKDENEKQTFALTNGKWVKTEAVPQGFLVNAKPSDE